MRRLKDPPFHLARIDLGGKSKLRITGYTPNMKDIQIMDEWDLVDLVRTARDRLRQLRQDRTQQDIHNNKMFKDPSRRSRRNTVYGDTVYGGRAEWTNEWVQCPSCLGSGVWHIVAHSGEGIASLKNCREFLGRIPLDTLVYVHEQLQDVAEGLEDQDDQSPA